MRMVSVDPPKVPTSESRGVVKLLFKTGTILKPLQRKLMPIEGPQDFEEVSLELYFPPNQLL